MSCLTRVSAGEQSSPLLRRHRLVTMLSRCTEVKLSLLTAPGGYGKTTLVQEMASAMPSVPFCWVRLHPTDARVSKLLQLMSTAVAPYLPTGGLGVPVSSAREDEEEIRQLARLTAAALRQHTKERLVLVLDDLHHMEASEPIHRFLGALIDLLPAHVHLIVTSRSRPRLRLARLHARDELLWIKASDLAFTAAEADQVLRQRLQVIPDEETVSLLVEQTEGWASGLLLVINLLRTRPRGEWRSFLAEFQGSTDLFDFLAEEVFLQQSPALQEFLLSTSVLRDVQPYVVERMLGIVEAGAILRGLQARNLFTFAMDETGSRFRYHCLFQAFLQQQLVARRGVEALHDLHQRAATVYQAQGRLAEALEHLLAAGAFEAAAPLMAELADAYIQGLRHEVVAGWLRRFPAPFLDHDPDVLYVRAQIAGWMAQSHVFPALYQRCLELYEQREDTLGLARTLSWVARRYWRLRQPYFAQKPDQWAVHPNHTISGYGRLLCALRLITQHRWTEAIDKLERLLPTLPPATTLAFDCQEALALLTFWVGDFRRSVKYGVSHTMGRSALGDFGWGIYNWVCYTLLGDGLGLELFHKKYAAQRVPPALVPLHDAMRRLGEAMIHTYHRRWEDQLAILEALQPYFNDGSALGRCIGSEATYLAQAEMARAYRRLGKTAEARQCLQRNLALTHGYPEMTALACADMADFLAEAGDVEGAHELLARAEDASTPGLQGLDYMVRMIVASRIALAEGNRAGAARLLAEVSETIRLRGCPLLLVHYGGPELVPLLVEMGGDLLHQVLEALGTEADRYMIPLLEHPDARVGRAAFALFDQMRERHQRRTSHLFKVFAFGTCRLYRHDQPVDTTAWKRTKVKLLLLLLLMRKGRPISKEAVMEKLWPSASAQAARTNLRATIHGLRRVLEPEVSGRESRYLVADRDTVALSHSERFWFDLWEFEELMTKGRAEQQRGKAAEAVRLFGLAADLCRGQFLPDIVFADYFGETRTRTERMLVQACMAVATGWLAEGQYREAIAYAQRVLEVDKGVEEAYQVLIQSYLGRGEREKALHAFKLCRKQMRLILGSEPSRNTQLLLGAP